MRKERTEQYVAIWPDNNDDFFLPGFKILNKQQGKGLLPAMRVFHNGQMKLIYRTEACVSLNEWMKKKEKDKVRQVVKRLTDTVLAMKTNGFLQAANLVLEPEMVFIDESSYQTYMIVLPLGNRAGQQGWEKKYVDLLRLISRETGEKMDFLELDNVSAEYIARSLEFEGVEKKKENFSDGKIRGVKKQDTPRGHETLILEYVEGGLLRQLTVNSEEYVIGKSPLMANGVIGGISTISRKHCKIIRTDMGFQVMDLGSLNGTYVNQIKVREGEKAALKAGDVLRLAKLDLRVRSARTEQIG